MRGNSRIVLLFVGLTLYLLSCSGGLSLDSSCKSNSDCGEGMVCDEVGGKCVSMVARESSNEIDSKKVICGDGTCSPVLESCISCPSDCKCGEKKICSLPNGTCEVQNSCGDGICQDDKGENCVTCVEDCRCYGDYVCSIKLKRCVKYDADKCGNGICDPEEDCYICHSDCCKGNQSCDLATGRCVDDKNCGNGICQGGENCSSCPADCSCPDGKICEKGACIEKNICGNNICEGSAGETCVTCPSDCSCPPSMYCSSKTGKCESKPCNTDAECSFLPGGKCVDGTCRQAPNRPKCKSDGDCKPGEKCVSGLCSADQTSSKCQKGKKECRNNSIFLCDGKDWKLIQSCSSSQVCKVLNSGDAKCEEVPNCKDGDRKCKNSKIFVCKGGNWSFERNCIYGCSGNACSECKSGAKTCSSDKKSVGTCKNGKWVFQKCANGEVCVSSSAGVKCQLETKCTPDSSKCIGNDLYTCKNNKYVKIRTCPYGCSGNKCCLCKSGDTRCRNNELSICLCRGWKPLEKCPSGQICINDKQCGKPECTGSSAICKGNDRYVCKNNKYVKDRTCTNGCSGGGCCLCKAGSVQCKNDKLYLCACNSWKPIERCPPGQVCINDKQCGKPQCTGSSSICKGNNRYVCKNYRYVDDGPCPNGCSGGSCCICKAGTSRCRSGGYEVCACNKWNRTPCPYGCCGGKCCECRDGATKCKSGKYLYTCRKGKFVFSERCPDKCQAGRCCSGSKCMY